MFVASCCQMVHKKPIHSLINTLSVTAESYRTKEIGKSVFENMHGM